MKRMAITVTMLAAALVGCASNAKMVPSGHELTKSGLINDPKLVSEVEKSLTDKDISMLLDAKVQAKLPSAIAIVKANGSYYGGCSLDSISAEELNAWQASIKDVPNITGIVPLTSLVEGTQNRANLHSLRVAAARMNCELLMVYLQTDAQIDNMNDAAVLYWTIIGLWTVPGNVMEYRSVMQAVLVDCRTGMILGTATGDSHLKKTYPSAFREQRHAELSREVPQNALADLQKGFGGLLRQVVAQAMKNAEKT